MFLRRRINTENGRAVFDLCTDAGAIIYTDTPGPFASIPAAPDFGRAVHRIADARIETVQVPDNSPSPHQGKWHLVITGSHEQTEADEIAIDLIQ